MEIISVKITSVFETGAVKAKANAVLGRFGVRGIKVCEGKAACSWRCPHTSLQRKIHRYLFPMDRKRRKSWPGPCSGLCGKQAENAAAAFSGQEPGWIRFCVRTSPEPYGARAGQRLPAQRLKPQGAEREDACEKELTAVCADGSRCALLRRRRLLRQETWRAWSEYMAGRGTADQNGCKYSSVPRTGPYPRDPFS